MKTWVTYIAAIAMGFATTLLFKDIEGAFGVFQGVFFFLLNLSIAIFIPVVLITFASGIASLRKDGVGSKISWGIFGWTLVTSILLPLCAVIVYKLFPVNFPVTSSVGSDAAYLENMVSNSSINAISQLYPTNPFFLVAYASDFILPIIIIAWILGFSLKPSSDPIRPAYTVMNSFAEVMYRITRTITLIGSLFVYVASTYVFFDMYREKTLLVAPRFTITIICGTLTVLFFVLPLLYALLTGFRKNPYAVIFGSISSLSMAFSTGNILAASLVGESVSRQNGGAQKRAVSVGTPIFSLVARGGTGFITTLVILTLMQAVTGEVVSGAIAIVIAATVMITSFSSSIFIGYEVVAIAYLTLKMLNMNFYGAEMAIVAIMPILSGLGIMLDNAIGNLGNVIASYFIGTDISVPYSETI